MANGLLSQQPLNDPDYYYGGEASFAPFRIRKLLDVGDVSTDASPEWTVPGIVRSVGNALMRGGQTIRRERPLDPAQTFMDLLEVAPAGLLAGRLAPKGATFGVFAGPRAETANRGMLEIAEDMAAKGASHENIWKKTGWFKDVDGKWKFEISDEGSKTQSQFLPSGELRPKISEGKLWRVEDTFKHPGLFAAYSGEKLKRANILRPQIQHMLRKREHLLYVKENSGKQGYEEFTDKMAKELDVLETKTRELRQEFDNLYGEMRGVSQINAGSTALQRSALGPVGQYLPSADEIAISYSRHGAPDKYRSTMLHELQHAIQQREGFGRGGNVESAKNLKITSDKWLRWRDHKHIVKEMDSIRSKKEYAEEIAKTNRLWAEKYKPRIEVLEKRLDDPNTSSPHQGKTWNELQRLGDEFQKEAKPMQPLYNRLASLQKQYGVNISEPPKYITPYEAYRRLSGEVEARNVETRADFSDAERKFRPPWTTRDVDEKDIILDRLPTLKGTTGPASLGLLNTDENERPRGRLKSSGIYDGLLAREEAIARRRRVPHDSQLYSGGII